jgi:hypothetical protein
MERGQGLVVGRRHVFGTAGVPEEGVLGADARVVKARGDGMRVGDLAVVVGQQRGAGAVQDARAARSEAGRTGCLDA